MFPAPDPAAQLIEFRKSEPVGTFDQDRVRIRHIEARLNDRTAHEAVHLSLQEPGHDLFKLVLVHLAVGDGEARLRNQRLQMFRFLGDRTDAVVQKVDLPAARKLRFDRLDDEFVLLGRDDRLDRQPLFRGGHQRGEVARARHREIECPRDRRRGHGQHIDLRPESTQPLLVFHAEPLFLVDHHESEIPDCRAGEFRSEYRSPLNAAAA